MRTVRSVLAIATALLGALACPAGARADDARADDADLARLLPAEIEGWRPAEADARYTPDTLYEYIDGAAELYRAFDFQRGISRRYVRPDQGDATVTVDVFELARPEDAFGLFAHGREGTPDEVLVPDVGQGAQASDGVFVFWKGREYVSILGYPETPPVRALVPQLARAIAAAITETGHEPALLDALPLPGRVEASVRYFHHPLLVNDLVFVSNENVLAIEHDCEAVLACYREADGRSVLALVAYPTAERAQQAEERFRSALLAGRADVVQRKPDGRWNGCRRDGTRLVVVLDAPSEASARARLAQAPPRPQE